MIDLRRWRDDEHYRAGAVAKGATPELADELIAADAAYRAAVHSAEQARAELNAASKAIGRADPTEREAKVAAAGQIKASVTELEQIESAAREALNALAYQVPNPAHESVPAGGEENFVTLREVGTRSEPPLYDHAAVGQVLGVVNSDSAVANSGTRFAYLMGKAVQLEFALVQWTLGLLAEHGFEPVVPPVLVREQLLVEAGFFPTDRHQVYEIDGDDLFLVGTAEVALAGLHRSERLDRSTLPRRYAGFSSCFRREAGTHGKDTRGIFRVHQFDKVEMFSFCDPDKSWDELEMLLGIQEQIVGALGLPYRVINVAAGDLGAAAAKKYDIEVWLPSEGAYREITSCSNYTDYSARRLGARYVDVGGSGGGSVGGSGEGSVGGSGGGSGLLHTLNGTACAVSRTLVFLFENAQQPNGSVVVPEVLRPFCGFNVIEPREGVGGG